MKKKTAALHITFAGLAGAALLICALPACRAAGPDEETLRRYIRAGEVYAEGRFAETAALLEGEKKFSQALVLRAKAEYFAGELEKAEQSSRRAIERRPQTFEARLYRARILRELGRAEEAREAAESLLADNPQDIRAIRLRAKLAGEGGKTDEAAALLDNAAELSAEYALALLDRARLRWVAGRSGEALADLGRARAMLPPDTPLLKSIEHLESRINEVLQ